MAAAFLVSGFFVFDAFAITSITVTNPVGGSIHNGIINITWTTTGASPGDTVDIVYSTNNFNDTVAIAVDLPFDSGFAWDTSAPSTPPVIDGNSYKIRISKHGFPSIQGQTTGFTIDNTPPEVNTGLDKTANAGFTQTGSVSDPTPGSGIGTIAWTKVSGPGTITFGTPNAAETTISANTDGTYILRLTATDLAGNSAFDEMTLTWDTTPPSVTNYTLNGGTDDVFFNPNNASIHIFINTNEDVKFNRIYVCAVADVTCDDSTAEKFFTKLTPLSDFASKTWDGKTGGPTPTIVADGEYKLKVNLEDVAGNTASEELTSRLMVVDTVPPTITEDPLTNPVENEVYKDTAGVPFTFTPNDTGTGTLTCSYSTDGGTIFHNLTLCTSGSLTDETAIIGFVDGRNSVVVRVTDAAGNSSVPSGPISIVFDDDDTLTVGSVVGPAPLADFDNIQEAVDKATAGDMISVAVGTYTELLNVNKNNLTIVGTGAVIIQDPVGANFALVTITGNGSSLSSLTLNASDDVSFAVQVNADSVTLTNLNITKLFAPGGAAVQLVSGVDNFTMTGGTVTSSFNGLLTDGVGPWSSIIIEGATFDVSGGDFSVLLHTITNGNVTNNIFNTSTILSHIIIGNADVVAVSDNTINGPTNATFGYGIWFQETSLLPTPGNMGVVTVTGNTISGARHWIFLDAGLDDESPDITVVQNSITGNTVAGITNNDTVNTLNATNNWWGSESGPTHADNTFTAPSGVPQGDAVSDNVDFVPWCQSVGPADCDFAPVTTNDIVPGAFSFLQAGINAITSGGTVTAAAGTFTEDVLVNKSVTLLSKEGADSTSINGVSTGFTGTVRIAADNITLGDLDKGFTINGTGQAAVYISGSHSGIIIQNNILVAATNKNALLTDGGQTNHNIKENTFNGDASQLVYVNGTPSVGVASTDINFTGNTFGGSATGPLLGQEADNSLITNNIFSGITNYAALEMHGDSNVVSGNSLTAGGLGAGILVSGFSAGTVIDASVSPNSISGFGTGIQVDGTDVIIRLNTISGNTTGLDNNSVVSVDAEQNWWGNITGPNHATSNPVGTGNAVSDDVDFSPFCLDVPSGIPLDCTLGSIDPITSFDLLFNPPTPAINTNSDLTVTALALNPGTPDSYARVNDSSSQIALNVASGVANLGNAILTLTTDGTTGTTVTSNTVGTAIITAQLTSNTTVIDEGEIVFVQSDTVAPVMLSHTPANGATDVAITVVPTITFSKALNTATVNSTNIQLREFDSNNSVPAIVSPAEGNTMVLITPSSPFENDTQYYLAVSNAVTDGVGNPLGNPFGTAEKALHSFTTVALQPVVIGSITQVNPSPTATGLYLEGWRHTFVVTINTTETDLRVAVEDWVNSAAGVPPASNEIVPADGNMRLLFNSDTGNGLGSILLDESIVEDGSGPIISIAVGNALGNAIDLTGFVPGQITFDIFTKIPVGTAAGFYDTEFTLDLQ